MDTYHATIFGKSGVKNTCTRVNQNPPNASPNKAPTITCESV